MAAGERLSAASRSLFPIRPSERRHVLAFFLLFAFVSAGATFARSIGMALLVGNLGRGCLPYMFVAVNAAVMVCSFAYAAATRRHSSLRIMAVLLLLAVGFTTLMRGAFLLPGSWSYALFFTGFFLFHILILIHAGGFLASYFDTGQMKRLSLLVYAGVPIGGMLGGFALVPLLAAASAESLVLLQPLCLGGALVCLRRIHQMMTPLAGPDSLGASRSPRAGSGTVAFLAESRLLRLMAVGLFLAVVVGKTLEFLYQGIIYPARFPDLTERTAFFAKYEVAASLFALVIQVFVAGRLLNRLGVGAANLIHPVLLCCAGAGVLVHPGFVTGLVAHFVNQELHMVFRGPATNLLYNGLPERRWGAARAFLNGTVFLLATVVASGMLIVAQQHFEAVQLQRLLPLLCVGAGAVGVLFALPQWRAYNGGILELLRARVVTDDLAQASVGIRCDDEIDDILRHADERRYATALAMISVTRAERYAAGVGRIHNATSDPLLRRQCVDTLTSLPGRASLTVLARILDVVRDPASMERVLAQLRAFSALPPPPAVERFMLHPYPAVAGAAARCLLDNEHFPRKPAVRAWLEREFASASPADRIALFPAVGDLGVGACPLIVPWLNAEQAAARAAAVTALRAAAGDDPDAVRAALLAALSDSDHRVVAAALMALADCQEPGDLAAVIQHVGADQPQVAAGAHAIARLHLDAALPLLVDVVFASTLPVRRRGAALTLVAAHLNAEQRHRLATDGRAAVARWLAARALQWRAGDELDVVGDRLLAEKLAATAAADALRWAVAVVAALAQQSESFVERVTCGLADASVLRRANAVEALSNARVPELVPLMIRIVEEAPADAAACAAVAAAVLPQAVAGCAADLDTGLLALGSPYADALAWRLRHRQSPGEPWPDQPAARELLTA
jgi:hypothetical protein